MGNWYNVDTITSIILSELTFFVIDLFIGILSTSQKSINFSLTHLSILSFTFARCFSYGKKIYWKKRSYNQINRILKTWIDKKIITINQQERQNEYNFSKQEKTPHSQSTRSLKTGLYFSYKYAPTQECQQLTSQSSDECQSKTDTKKLSWLVTLAFFP